MLSLQEIGAILVKHLGYHEGIWDISVEFQISIGALGPSADKILPGAMVGVSRIGLMRTETRGPHTVDAAVVNPAP